MTGSRALFLAVLVAMGALWGITLPLAKVAVVSGYRPFGITFWTLSIGALVLGAVALVTGRRLVISRAALVVYIFIALVGTLLPNAASYTAARHLPAGILSIGVATVPMLAFPIALALGTDGFSWRRLGGLALGLFAMVLIALPEASLPEAAMVAWLPLALVPPLLYAVEGNAVAKWGTAGLDPVQVLLGASIIGAAIALPIALVSGSFIDPRGPWQTQDWAILGIALAHITAYTTYVWLVGQTGAVFATQAGYIVTGSGVIWAMVLLGERYSAWIWAALAVMLLGVFLVTPRAPPRKVPGAGQGTDPGAG